MKKKGMLYYFTIILLAVFSSSCMEDIEYGREPLSGNGLKIELATPGISSRATEAGVDVLNENKLGQAVLMIFDEYGNRTSGGYKVLDFSDNTEAVIAIGNWKEDTGLFSNGADASYDLYVLANVHGNAALEAVTTLEGLKNEMDKDADIWKFEGASISGNKYGGKVFAMSGVMKGFVPENVDDDYTVKIQVERLAAKVEVTIGFDDEFKGKFKPTGFYSALRNYATNGLWLDDKEGQFNDRGLAGNGANEPMADAYASDVESQTARLLLYTYPNDWGNDVLSETFVLLNMPGNYNGGEGDQDNGFKESNYYKIPIRLGGTDEHRINRNTIYRVDVTIDRLGQLKPDVPVELNPGYEVVPWDVVNINVDDTPVNFLELQKEEIIMKNISTSDEQFFTSSANVTATIQEVYYYDKYGAKKTISSNQYYSYGISVSPENSLSGRITVNSNIPTNNGIRYIIVNVSNGTITKSFKVKQYPLEYIVTVPGWYSYRDDFGSTYEYEGTHVTSNRTFRSKVYYEGAIYEYGWERTWYRWSIVIDNKQTSNPNNKMYFVRITKTSDTYVLSEPMIDAGGYTESSAKNNQLVAPAFMIASQLGTVSAQGFDSAKEHCKQYAEKSLAGNVYDDWRLATEAELKIIDKYQNTPGSVIDVVLGGKYYWAASGNAVQTRNGTQGTSYNAYIRCVRTVKPDEPIVNEKE